MIKNDKLSNELCITDLAESVGKLWESVNSGIYDSRSIVGDITFEMQESILQYTGIDVRGEALLKPGIQEFLKRNNGDA